MATAIQEQEKKSFNYKMVIHVGVVLLLMFGFKYLPAPEPISIYGMATVGIFIGMIYGWTISPNNMVWPSLLGMVALGTTDFGGSAQVMRAAFGSEVIVLNMMGMLMIGALAEAGVAEWLIVKLISAKFAQSKPWTLTGLLVIGPFFLAMFISPMILTLFLLALYGTMFSQAGYERGDKYVVMVSLGVVLSVLFGPMVFPFKGVMLMFLPVVTAGSGVTFDFAKYMMTIIPFALITIFLYVILMRLLGCNPSKIVNADISDVQAKYQYGLSNYQKAILACIICFVLGAVTVAFGAGPDGFRLVLKKFGVHGWAMVMCAVMQLIRIKNKALIDPTFLARRLNLNILFVIASATTISAAMTSDTTGVSTFLSQLAGPLMSNLSPVAFLIVACIITFVCTNVFNNLATVYTMIAVACALFNTGLNFNMEIAGIMIAYFGVMGFLTPGASVYGALVHSQEYNTPSKLYLYGGIAMIHVIVCMICIYLPLTSLVY